MSEFFRALKGQLTVRGLVIGCIGCVIITAASAYTALKLGALPWPIIFAAVISLFFLKSLSARNGRLSARKKNNMAIANDSQTSAAAEDRPSSDQKSDAAPSNTQPNTQASTQVSTQPNTQPGILNEANVTHTIMSAGAMVAGGLAFTIPGIWMLGYADQVAWWQMLIVACAGVSLGLVCSVLMRRHFVENKQLRFPIGQAAAQTLLAGNSGGKSAGKLFGAMGFAGVYTFLRDWLGVLPAMLLNGINIPGIAFGIYNSPMLLAVGFLVGTGAVLTWFAGALFGNFGLVFGGFCFGLWDIPAGKQICASVGMGVMIGAGLGVVIRMLATTKRPTKKSQVNSGEHAKKKSGAIAATIIFAAIALLLCFALELGPLPSIVVVALVWATTAMSSQSVGLSGIDPMEIFGLIVMLLVAAFANVTLVQLFFVAAVIAVACGLTGDVMSDFKAGQIIGTNPRAQWLGQAIGGILGAIIAVIVMVLLLKAYGADSFGANGSFVSAQASVLATMVTGIPSVPAFVTGVLVGFVLSLLNAPAMLLGLGIYLPFYLSFSAFLGAMAKLAYDRLARLRRRARNKDKPSLPSSDSSLDSSSDVEKTGLLLASGLLGGESIVGVLIALAAVIAGLAA